ncbi:MAG: 2,3-bisphosphoglycerate-independent phosphoglycerate mutase [Okeania sp. SIO3B5]|uniref:2,3-bisphosphoglycerate-independent phosphoglycerate mutase n=1 Tax=Okeania sp. SIO3B5 TaxID=2607811 RepID=UPI0013FF6D01|nr:2,3-bisphosphoglycerate-independent phosphoglycerate mutase [Okeania sp. SIO3B5]NEO57186.1 2,3-bisphosphoglycerate-independent phosphoglycerate mutase [Okeania sp. SIO3B5]
MGTVYISPVVLIILDGWGYREEKEGNAIAVGETPIIDSLWQAYPRTLIQASGKAVGLPEGQMGNSEVGHLNIGAGRIVPQELVRISDAIEDGSIAQNQDIERCCQDVIERNSKLHLVGLCSPGGVHSHVNHLLGLLDMAKAKGISDVCIHAITDGRDTNPKSGVQVLKQIEYHINQSGVGRIATISGRYYAMDRDKRWDRIQKAYEVMTKDGYGVGCSASDLLQQSYTEGITDEFVIPVRVSPGAIEPGDGVIFFNFRPDRARQLTQAFVDIDFNGFECQKIQPLTFLTFTQYDSSLPTLVAFKPQNLNNILGQVISQHGLRQLRTAETEKYAHVTYFFNGGLEQPFEGEDRELIQSPMVAHYDEAPEMSAEEVTEVAIAAVEQQIYSLIVINYANPDMVGHTGVMDAAVNAVKTVDYCLGQLLDSISKAGGTAIIIADHGNAEYMWDEEGNPWTAHTTNPVPFILIEGEGRKIPGHGAEVPLRKDGCLADVAPTILEILQLPQPPEMTGRSIIENAGYDIQQNLTPMRVGL